MFFSPGIAPKSELDVKEKCGTLCSTTGATLPRPDVLSSQGLETSYGRVMAFFWYNPFSGEKLASQFINYLQATSFASDLRQTIAGSAVTAASIAVDSLEEGFERIERQSAEFRTAFDWRLSLIADQQQIANMLLKNLAVLLRVPDSEKQRLHFIEQGLRYYTSATRDPDLYADALEFLQKAEALEKQDYQVLYRLGLIYLQASDPRFLDFAKAEQYFRRAAKYSLVDVDPHTNEKSDDRSDGGEPNAEFLAHKICTDSLRLAAMSCYLQEKFDEAVSLADEASEPRLLSFRLTLSSSWLEAKYLKAKSLFALNETRRLSEILEDIFVAAPLYALRAALDFGHDKSVVEFLSNLRETKIHECLQVVEKCRNFVRPGTAEARCLREIDQVLAGNNLVGALTVEPRLEGIWVRLIHDQRDRLMKAARVLRDAKRKLRRCERTLKRFQIFDARRADEEEAQRRRWFFKDKSEIDRLEAVMRGIAPDGIVAIESKRESLEKQFQKAFSLLAEERKRSLSMQAAFLRPTEAPFSEDFITLCIDLIRERKSVRQELFQECFGLTPDESWALLGELENRGFISQAEKGTPATVIAKFDDATLYWNGIGLRMPRRRDRL